MIPERQAVRSQARGVQHDCTSKFPPSRRSAPARPCARGTSPAGPARPPAAAAPPTAWRRAVRRRAAPESAFGCTCPRMRSSSPLTTSTGALAGAATVSHSSFTCKVYTALTPVVTVALTPFWPARALAAWAMARRAAWAPAAALLLLSPPAAVARGAAPRRVVGASGRCQQLQDTYYSEEMWLAPGEMVFTNPKTMPVTMPQGGQYYVTGFEGTEGAREAGRACQQSWDPNNMLEHTGLT